MTMIHQKSSDGGDFPMDNNLVPYQTLRPWLRQVKMLPIMPPTVLWLWPIGISENALWRNNRMVQSVQNMGSDWFQSCPMNWQRSSVKAILSVISIITVDFISIYLMPRFCTRVCKILIGRICARYCVFMMKMLAFDIWMKLSMRATINVLPFLDGHIKTSTWKIEDNILDICEKQEPSAVIFRIITMI